MNTACVPQTPAEVMRECREILERNSKTFAMAAKLLSPEARDRAAAVYAYCRRVDDAIDGAAPADQPHALAALRTELAELYAGKLFSEPALRAFQAVAQTSGLPFRYPSELIEGMAMDVRGARYEQLEDLLLYCHRVAGVVGLMMCHVFGITRDAALEHAAHLGIAMQLTNICRDVQEDWGLGRLYLPRAMLRRAGAERLSEQVTGAFPQAAATQLAMRRVMQHLLGEADRYYASAERGIVALPFTAGLAVRAARTLYHAIGLEVANRGYDPTRGRAVVSTLRKLWLVAKVGARHLLSLGAFGWERLKEGRRVRAPRVELSFPADVLPAAAARS